MPASVQDEVSSTGSRESSPAAALRRTSRRTPRQQRDVKALIGGLHLHEAIIRGETSAVESILKARVDVNAKYKGLTPLMRASKRGTLDCVRLLLVSKADVNAQNKREERPLHLAAAAGHLEVVKALVHSGADLTGLNKRGQSFLFAAVVAGQLPVIRFVLENLEHYDIEQRDAGGRSLLHAAAHHGHKEITQVLLEAGCDVTTTDQLGRTPLHAACAESRTEAAAALLRQEAARPDAVDRRGATCLHLAVLGQARPLVELLLSRGASVDAANQDGETPLHLAVKVGSAELTSFLLSAGCSANSTTKTGNTPLHLAAAGDVLPISRSLINKGVDVSTPNKRGETALHVAADTGNEELCRLLMDRGAALEAREQCGRTPLYVAARGGFDSLVDVMICHSRSRKGNSDNPASSVVFDDETHLKLLILPPIIRVTWLNNNQSERVEELLRAVANRFLPRGKWKQLARHWKFTEDQIEAIGHQFVGAESYKAHGYRLLRLWHRTLGSDADPARLLQDSLISVGAEPSIDLFELMANEEEMQKFSSPLDGSHKQRGKVCPRHCLCIIM